MSGDVLMAFTDPSDLLAAIGRARETGYSRLDAYSPFALEGLSEALDLPKSRIRVVMFAGGVIGAAAGYAFQYWSAVYAYPFNSGGRPLVSWPAFMLVTFETTILFAVIAGFVAFLVRSELTALHKPIFESAVIQRASQDMFILRISATDPRFDRDATLRFAETLSPEIVEALPS